MTVALAADSLQLSAWRDPDEEVLGLPGVALGDRPAQGDPAALAKEFYDSGVRRVALSRPVDLTGEMDAGTLVWVMILLRELTSWGVLVDWRLRPGEHVDVWQRLNHLCPPAELIGAADAEEILDTWRTTFYLCKCIYRHGPGFVEVRDRRSGDLARFVLDDPAYLAEMDLLVGGAPVARLDPGILADFVAEGLAGLAGDVAWWLPYRVRRWPWPSMIV